MSVRDYYYAHFEELQPDKKFHFATRIKNYFHCDDFQEYFRNNMPSTDLHALLENNDFSHVNNVEVRRPFFLKYNQLYGIDAALFRINHLLNEYHVDLRADFLQLISLERLYKLADDLMVDNAAIVTLSTWAVNVVCLIETLYPRHSNVIKELAENSLAFESDFKNVDPLLIIYLYTHIILCDSNFYTRPVTERKLARKMLEHCSKIIEDNFEQLILDVRIEFLVCSNMVDVAYPELRSRIAAECRRNLDHNPYLIDSRRPKSYYSLNGAEHTNVLFIMSGLDKDLN